MAKENKEKGKEEGKEKEEKKDIKDPLLKKLKKQNKELAEKLKEFEEAEKKKKEDGAETAEEVRALYESAKSEIQELKDKAAGKEKADTFKRMAAKFVKPDAIEDIVKLYASSADFSDGEIDEIDGKDPEVFFSKLVEDKPYYKLSSDDKSKLPLPDANGSKGKEKLTVDDYNAMSTEEKGVASAAIAAGDMELV